MGKKKRVYGKTYLGQGVTLTGVDEYLSKVEKLGKDIFEITKQAMDESVQLIATNMRARAYRHKKTGEVYDAIEARPAIRSGNTVTTFVGIDFEEHPEAKHAIYQEYGGNKNKSFPDPFIRPAFDTTIRKVRAVQKQIFKKAGVPVD